jgi:hypothetical protein
MTTLTDRLRHHALLHQQCTVQDDEQRMFADDLLTAAAEIDGLRVESHTLTVPLPEPKKYFGVDAEPDFSYYTAAQMRDYAADVSAAARVQGLMWKDERDAFRDHRDSTERLNLLLGTDNVVLRSALKIAEAALADIGDATREPGDDLAWCERRAAQALPAVRAALRGKT